ncbi:MAG TPA: hypothetical protein ENI20_19790 [Bacteroides sp.]|nr:hypothetical protein [Bacteroides sp.]
MNFFKIYPEHRFIHSWTTGSDSGSLLEFYKEVAAHSDFSKDFVGLADMRDASLDFSPEQAMSIGRFVVDSDYSHSRWVFLVSEPAATALSLVYQNIVMEKHEIFVVSTLEAASEYLELDLKTIIKN